MSTITVPLGRLKSGRLQVRVPNIARQLLLPFLLAWALWSFWQWTALPVSITVDGVTDTVRTHRRTLEPLLADLGLAQRPADRVSHPLDAGLERGMVLSIERARTVRILADGRDLQVYSQGRTVAELLADAGIGADAYDQVLLNDKAVALEDPVLHQSAILHRPTYQRGHAWDYLHREPLQVRIYRAIPISVDDGSVPFTVRTTAQTVGEALRQAQITLYLGDKVQPSLGSPVSTGLRVFIQRSIPVSLWVDGRHAKTRIQGRTVGDALTDIGVGVSGLDRVEPALDARLYDGIEIKITRVAEEIEIEEEIVPFETIYVADGNLPIDTQQVVHPGAEGITRWRYRVRYEDGEVVDQKLEDTWVAQEPAQRMIAYGQKIAPQTFTTSDGRQLTYWRKVQMLASSYSAATAGVSTDQSWYGRTRTGAAMRHGIVAIDPNIVPLGSQVYVPGYGVGDALDTGTAIRARRIDLGYDDSNLVLWKRWVDVYLLWPPPPDYQITWVLPNWPTR